MRLKKTLYWIIILGTIISCSKDNDPNPSNGRDLANTHFIFKTLDGMKIIDHNGNIISTIDDIGMVEVYNNIIHILSHGEIRRYDISGSMIGKTIIPAEIQYCINFSVLPSNSFALYDNQNDNVYFISYKGVHLKTVKFSEPNPRWQNMSGIIIGNELIISENGKRQLFKIDLNTYEIEQWRSFPHWQGAWLGAIDNVNEQIYLCNALEIFTFSGDQPEKLVAELPDWNITGLAIVGRYAFVTINFIGAIYKVDLSTGTSELILSLLKAPGDIEAFSITTNERKASARD